MANLEHEILKELIYERVRVSVNLCQLVVFENDLDRSIKRAIESCDEPAEQRARLARRYVDEAWQRIEQEWDELRVEDELELRPPSLFDPDPATTAAAIADAMAATAADAATSMAAQPTCGYGVLSPVSGDRPTK